VDSLLQDLRFAIRMLVKNPGFSAVAVLTLALGIGANTAIFSAVNAVLLRPLPYADPHRLVLLNEETKQLSGMSVAWPNYVDWRDQNRSFERLSAVQPAQINLTGLDRPQHLGGWNVTHDFFQALGVRPLLGRDFLAEDDRPGAHPVALLGYGLYQRQFGGDPTVVGRTLTLNGTPCTVVGVLPASFRFYYGEADVFRPIGPMAGMLQERNDHPGIYVLGRLRPGATLDAARADMDTIAVRLERAYPKTNSGNRVALALLEQSIVQGIQPVLLVLSAAVGFVLLIACANVAGLLLARASARSREIAIRRALGAGRRRLLRQVLTESSLLGLIGGALGLVLAAWLTDVLLALVPASVPRIDDVRLDAPVLAFTLLLSLLTGLLFGLVPAWQSGRAGVAESLKEGSRGSSAGRRQQRFRSLLVVSEVALSLLLLIGAGLVARSFLRLRDVDPGFRPDHVVSAQLSLPQAAYPDDTAVRRFADRLLERAAGLPGVTAAALVNPLPLSFEGWQTNFWTEDRAVPAHGEFPNSDYHVVTGDYFRTMGIRLVRGRLFTDADSETAPPVTLINETLARRFWPDRDPVGQRMRTGSPEDPGPWITVVGVVADVKQYGLDSEQKTQFYRPLRQLPLRTLTLVLRTSVEPAGLTTGLRDAVAAVDADLPIDSVRSMGQLLSDASAPKRLSLLLLGSFAVTALLLAAVGIYGVLAFSVAQRTQEIGIRMALGARRRDVQWMVLGQGLRLALVGVAVGLAAAPALTRLMTGLLFGVSPTDPATLATVCALLIAVAGLASLVPAHRASRVDPMISLRSE